MSRRRDAEAELNLPPGFRFHPTDEVLVRHYLCRKAAGLRPPVAVIAEIDLYKFDPWELPEKALFGEREWYFFTTRDRKYPNGSRPNRAAGRGYWKATGADKPVAARESGMVLGIKKALVFYSGKSPRGVKTDWIMHEYRLADANRAPVIKGTLRLDDWCLCRLYNKKNNWEKAQQRKEETSVGETMESMDDTGSDQSFKTPESAVENDAPLLDYHDSGCPSQTSVLQGLNAGGIVGHPMAGNNQRQDDDWFVDLRLEDLESSYSIMDAMGQDYCIQSFVPHSPVAQPYQFSSPSDDKGESDTDGC